MSVTLKRYSTRDYIEYYLIFLMLAVSGGIRFGGFYISLFLVSSFIAFCVYGKGKTGNYNVKIFAIYLGWIILNNYLFIPLPRNSEIWRFLFFSTSMFFVVSIFDFGEFRRKIYNAFNVLCWISIAVHVACRYLHLIPFTYVPIHDHFYGVCLYFFHVAWGAGGNNVYSFDNRFSSIYWEPGQFQVVATFVLVLFIPELINIQKWKVNIKKFSSIIIAYILTFSTAGYLVLGLFLFYILTYNTKSRKNKILLPFGAIVGGLLFYAVYNTDVVQRKLEGSETSASSYSIRLADNMALLDISNEYPLTGVGLSSSNYKRLSLQFDSITASNGWLVASATNGYPFLIFILVVMYLGICRMKLGIPALYSLSLLFISQCNEWSAVTLPYLFIYFFKFRTYRIKSLKHV